MPSGTCSRRAGFADTIRLLASLIVLGCAIAGRTAENAFGKRGNSLRTPSAWAERSAPLCTLMAWQWSAPAYLDGMPGQPICSLQWRAHSEPRRLAPAGISERRRAMLNVVGAAAVDPHPSVVSAGRFSAFDF